MNFCDKCKVHIEENVHHCPLCGRSVDDTPKAMKITRFPDYAKFYKHRLHITTLLARIFAIFALLSVIVNLVFPTGVFWSAYVIAGVFLAITGILIPIRYRLSFSLQTKFQILGISAVLIVAEVLTGTFGWGVGYAIPGVLAIYAITCSVMLLVKGYVDFEYFLPLSFILFVSAILYILNKFAFHLEVWPVLVPLLISLLAVVLLFALRYKRTIKCIKKHWKI